MEQKPIGNKHLLHECVVVVIAYKTENTFSLWTRNFQCECTMEWKVGRKMEQVGKYFSFVGPSNCIVYTIRMVLCTCSGPVYEAKLRNLNDVDINMIVALCASSSPCVQVSRGKHLSRIFHPMRKKSYNFRLKYVIIRIFGLFHLKKS